MDTPAAGPLPGPLHQPQLGLQLRLECACPDVPGAVLCLRCGRERLPVHVPGPLLCCLLPGSSLDCSQDALQQHPDRLGQPFLTQKNHTGKAAADS